MEEAPDKKLGDSAFHGFFINHLYDLGLEGCLPGLIFSDMNTFIIHDLEPMCT